MANHDYVIANQNGANTRSDLNNALSAIVSNNSSVTAPSTTYAFMWWADTGNDLLKQRNAADSAWIDILTLSTAAPLGPLSSTLLTGALPAIDGSALTGLISGLGSNILINGDFGISQRGSYTTATNMVTGTYYLDRWRGRSVNVTSTIQDITNKVKMIATSSATGTMTTEQWLEDKDVPLSVEVTFSATVKSNTAQAKLVVYDNGTWHSSSAHTGGGADEVLSVTFTPTSTADFRCTIGLGRQTQVSITSGDYLEISKVKLEVGSTATDFEYRGYGEELALCQRYYEKSYSTGVYAGNATQTGLRGNGGVQGQTATTEVSSVIEFVVSKRIAPTVVFYDHLGNTGKCSRLNASVAWYANESVGTPFNISTTSLPFYSGSGNTATGVFCHFTADAEL